MSAVIRLEFDNNPTGACSDPECCGGRNPTWFVIVDGDRRHAGDTRRRKPKE